MLAWLSAIALASSPVAAGDRPGQEIVQIREGAPVTIRPDRAYLIIRVHKPKGVPTFEPVLMRIPARAEMDAYNVAKAQAFAEAEPKLKAERERALARKSQAEAAGKKFNGDIPPVPSLETFNFVYAGTLNVNAIANNWPFVKGQPDSLFLVETLPGDFVLYGASWGMGWQGLHVCFCLGTVGFTAKAGEVTDLGTFYADAAKSKSIVPELAAETGFGPSSDTPNVLIAGTVRPVAPGTALPPALAGVTVVRGEYRAVGKYFNPNAGGVNRLVPVPGVLSYDRGKVIDVKSGKEAPGAYPFR
ncbi:hypothetical protein [Sphingomonas sp. G-3-2-10]|uniref:hypothetical protein n=1 Tax=Sphingomonas sp. G-3-2-10 TaxID=2728838 RepID=UPI00146D7A6B|nr:hypothetical protein [Sphingomonas sp. G-3-2-10]NML04513.1 hypothetical protein [Sphingomonas sp. G-3-2-10]